MALTIALAGNPNSGKTTLFNALTGSNQFVGNWPGVTVEKKEGRLKFKKEVTVTDLPGIYSLSPYTLEEVVSRNYLLGESPDVILNIADGTNLERNLYLTTQLLELGIPVVIAVNMADIIEKTGQRVNIDALSRALGVPVIGISALKGTKVKEAAELAVAAAENKTQAVCHSFSQKCEDYIAQVESIIDGAVDESKKRFFVVKLLERDDKILSAMKKPFNVDSIIEDFEAAFDDDSESIITNERYEYISGIIGGCVSKKSSGVKLSVSDKIDRVVTNRFLALPIFAIVMYIVYYVSVTSVGTLATDWANDGVFGDGWHLFGIGSSQYSAAMEEYAADNIFTDELKAIVDSAAGAGVIGADEVQAAVEEGDFGAFDEAYGSYADSLADGGYDISEMVDTALEAEDVPDTSAYGIWVPGIPVLAEGLLTSLNCSDWVQSLVLDGIIGGVGAVLGFVPQMMVLFIFLAILESCGYMARIAFIMDRIFRRFGLSGKSFIPMLIGTGCGVPGVMASRTIENDRDRKMTIMTTTFIPCGAKLPIIALISSALFGGAAWVAPSAYFLGVAAIIVSGIILKKTKMFEGDPAPFVMELPAYHMPTVGNVLRSMWERAWSFIKKAGTIILISSIVIWAGSSFGSYVGANGASAFGFLTEEAVDAVSVLDAIGNAICFIFAPLGFGDSTATVATIMGLVAKEEVVGVFGVLDFVHMTEIAGYSFLAFNLLCAPCFAAIGAIRREMNNAKWTAFAITYQCVFAYAVALIIYQLGGLIIGEVAFGIGTAAAVIVLVALVYLLVRPYKQSSTLKEGLYA